MGKGDDAYKYPWSPVPMLTLRAILGKLLISLSLSFLIVKWKENENLPHYVFGGLYKVTYSRHEPETLAYNQHSIIIIYYRSMVCYLF